MTLDFLGCASGMRSINGQCVGYLPRRSCTRIRQCALAPNIHKRSLVREFRSQGSDVVMRIMHIFLLTFMRMMRIVIL